MRCAFPYLQVYKGRLREGVHGQVVDLLFVTEEIKMAPLPAIREPYGAVPKILNKIIEAKTAHRCTQDCLAKTLGFPGGSYKPFIPVAKRIGLLSSDGTPTDTYNRFRDPNHRKTAIAKAVRTGYSERSHSAKV
jgi:hypothetical protein